MRPASVTLGSRAKIDSPADGISAFLRQTQPLVELKVPFAVTREAIDNVDRGAKDSDWDPVRDAAAQLALAEDRALTKSLRVGELEWRALASIELPAPATKEGYVAVLMAVRGASGAAGPEGRG